MFGKTGNDLFPGELHVPQMTSSGVRIGNYIGPGTQIIKRLKRGDNGVSDVDRTAKVHDIQFTLAEKPEDVRKADMRMLHTLQKIRKRGSDYDINITPAETAIRRKIQGEDVGILSKGSFSGMRGVDLTAEDRKLLEDNLEKMTQLGYGANRIHKPRALYGSEIEQIMKNQPNFMGVYAKNQLEKIKPKKNMSLIFNLNNSNQSGSHWVAILNDSKMPYCEFFDSFGIRPPKNAIKFMQKTNKPIQYNNTKLQKNNSILCGFFCIEYIKNRNKQTPKEVFRKFVKNPSLYNELKVIHDSF